MPKLLFARPPLDATEERQVRKLAGARHAPGDWIRRARMIALSWQGQRTTAIATTLGRHPQTVRERLARFNAEGVDGLGDRPGAGRTRRLTERERGVVIALARGDPPGKTIRRGDGALDPGRPDKEARWSLDALTAVARERGVRIARSQVRRILTKEGVRWRRTHTWGTSEDPHFAPKEHGSSPSTRARLPARRPCASTNRPRDPARVPARAGLVARRPPDQSPTGVQPRSGKSLGVWGATRARRSGTYAHRAVAQHRWLPASVGGHRPCQSGGGRVRDHGQSLQSHQRAHPTVAGGPPARGASPHPDGRVLAEPARGVVAVVSA